MISRIGESYPFQQRWQIICSYMISLLGSTYLKYCVEKNLEPHSSSVRKLPWLISNVCHEQKLEEYQHLGHIFYNPDFVQNCVLEMWSQREELILRGQEKSWYLEAKNQTTVFTASWLSERTFDSTLALIQPNISPSKEDKFI